MNSIVDAMVDNSDMGSQAVEINGHAALVTGGATGLNLAAGW